jgi:hypothetical protein
LQGRTEQNEVTEQTAGRNRQQYQPARLAKNPQRRQFAFDREDRAKPILAIRKR